MSEAILAAVIVAQLAEMRIAMRSLCKRVDTLESRQPPPPPSRFILRAGIALAAGLSVYALTH